MKIRCLDNKRYKDLYTIGKVYDFEPEKGMINDLGGNNFRRFKTFEMLNEASGAEWELVENAVSKIKVRCLDNTGNQNMYMQGKIYDLVPGRGIIGDDGRIVYICESFEDLQMNSGSKWELVEDEIEEETAEQRTYLLKCTATSSDCCEFTTGKEYIYTVGKGIVDDGGTVLLERHTAVEDIIVPLSCVFGAEFELVSEVPSISRAYAELGKKLVENMAIAEAVESEELAVDYLEKYREVLEERDKYKNELENLREVYELNLKEKEKLVRDAGESQFELTNQIKCLIKECRDWKKRSKANESCYTKAVVENTKLHEEVKELKEELEQKNENLKEVIKQANKYAEDLELIKSFVDRIVRD